MKLIRDRRQGQALVEYALILALVAIICILVVQAVGSKTSSTFNNVQSQMSTQGVTSTGPVTPD